MIDQSSGDDEQFEDGDLDDEDEFNEPDYIQEMELAEIDPSTVKKQVAPDSSVKKNMYGQGQSNSKIREF